MPLRTITIHTFMSTLPVLLFITAAIACISTFEKDLLINQLAHGLGGLTLLFLLGFQATILRDFSGNIERPTIIRKLLAHFPISINGYICVYGFYYLHSTIAFDRTENTHIDPFSPPMMVNGLWAILILSLLVACQTLSRKYILKVPEPIDSLR